ncbi:MAG: arsenite methyltransferase [Candidatus Rokubacteria bacterium]|nr:arsenite methyltransferase [Candidatus Rokubacteria bacterium]
MSNEDIKTKVREKYGQAALRVVSGESSCCGSTPSCSDGNPITSDLYAPHETAGLPAQALEASLGCGNPVTLAELRPGETVLDLGSGGGIDVLLSARRVGPTGKAYGLDMTDEMLALARENQAKAGVTNAEFLKGEIEAIPLPDASVDVVISNCVINLSADKRRVIAEAFRVLRAGGRFAVTDIVVDGEVPDLVRKSMEAWTGCLAGALTEDEYRALLAEAGFEAVQVEPIRIYRADDARAILEGDPSLQQELESQGVGLAELLAQADGKFRSAFIRAVKLGGPGRSREAGTGAITIGPATRDDLPAIVALLTRSGLPEVGLSDHLATTLVAREGATVVGSAALELYGTAALLRSVAVEPALRRRKVGEALARAALELARRHRVATVYLLTETAAGFFSRLGFRAIARAEVPEPVQQSAQFGASCCSSAQVMVIALTPDA